MERWISKLIIKKMVVCVEKLCFEEEFSEKGEYREDYFIIDFLIG